MPDDKPEFLLYVPNASAPPAGVAEPQSLETIAAAVGRIVKIHPEDVRDQWQQTLDTLAQMTSTIANRADAWKIDEISVGLTLSASGQLLFIAEAGAQASITFILRPKV